MEATKDKHRLRISHQLGKGAFGEVFKGTYDGEIVAVKTITNNVAGADQQNAFAMFQKEAVVLAQCNHGRIIGYKALCRLNTTDKKQSSGGRWALVLEYAQGGTLANKVVACMTSPGSKVYSTTQALSWALDVATALEYLHSKSPAVFHRDVKLGNIVLAKEEGAWVAKLSDFGLHIVADDKQQQLLRVSTAGEPGQHSKVSYITPAPGTPYAAQLSPDPAAAAPMPSQQGRAESSSSASVSAMADKSQHSTCSQRCIETSMRRGSMSGGGWSTLTQQHLQQLQQHLQPSASSTAGATNPHGPACACCNEDSAQQLRTLSGNLVGCGQPRCAAGHGVARAREMFYGEMHDSSGSVPYVVTQSAAGGLLFPTDTPGAAAAGTSRRKAPARRCASFSTASSSTGQAPDESGRAKPAPRRTVSFKLQSPPPPPQQQQQPSTSRAGASVADVGTGAGGAAPSCGHLAEDDDVFGDASDACSIATDGTWLSDGTCCTAATSATGSTASDASAVTAVELVYDLTGKTGSYLYMAPEVWDNKPYNEKADVFSFGVVLYELLARCLLLFTELPTNSTDPVITEQYASKVCGGYRPSRPKHIPDDVWALIEDCWHQDPACRPTMSEVGSNLQQLLLRHQGGNSRRNSFSAAPGGSTATAGPAAAAVGNTHIVTDQVVGQHTAGAGAAAAGCGCIIS